MMQKIILFFIVKVFLLINCTSQLNSQPVPKCQTGFFYKTLPLIAEESYITNLDHLFNGYNLEYKLEDHEDFKQFITLGQKMKMQGRQIPDVPLIGLKNYHIDKKGNAWGNSFIALTQRSQRTFVHYGVINSNTSAPIVNSYISVQNNTNTTCFDAVLFKQQNLILVDCVVKLPKPNTKGQVLQNLFYYFRISDGGFIKNVKTEMFINYRSITRRSLLLYSDLFNSHTFLLRSYFYNDIEKPFNQNTYIQVFMLSDPQDPWVVEIIDRAFLNAKTLSITDVRIYLGEIFILDNKMGVYRVYINTQEDLKFNGFYQAKGFQKFSVYSNNLDNHFQLALANSHSVLQIDWTNQVQPRLINKYSLMPDSKVSQIFLNERFLFVQSQSKADDSTYNYTWIMNRGDRTYTKAFKVIKHNSGKTIIDVNQDMSYLIVIDDEKLANYKLDDSNMVITIKKDEDLLDKINTFKITAISKDQLNNGTMKKCQILVNFTLLEDNNRTMWPIGDAPPSKFTANFPGRVQIKLHQYVLGPNVTYKLRETDHDVIKKLKVYQQEQLKLTWQTPPPFLNSNKMRFLLTQTVNYQNQTKDLMHLYLQDDQNITYFVTCYPQHTLQQVTCQYTHQQQFQGEINNWSSGFFLNRYTLQQNHVIAYTTKKHYNKVSLIDFTQNQRLEDINLQKGFAGNATSVAITNKQLYVVLKYVKSVQIYDLQLCLEGFCQAKCRLDYLKMYQLGIKYFSPTQVHTSVYHPNTIFIKTSDQIIVVDYNAECKPKLLGTILPVDTAQIQFSFKLNEKFLIITIQSLNKIKQYNIERISLGDFKYTKEYPRYGFSLPKSYELDVSDKGNCIYVTMMNEAGDHQVFVYRSGYPAVGSLYDVIDLVSYEAILVDTTGYEIDYISVYADKALRIFRQYEEPLAQVFNPNISYSFYLDYSNPSSRSNLEQIDVKIINLPTLIKVNPFLNDIMNTRELLYSGIDRVNEINDSKWWQGNVLSVDADCDDCRGQYPLIRVLNHIQHQEQIKLAPAMNEYQWSPRGGSIQAVSSIVNMRHNGSINQIVKLPFKENQLCITLAIGYRSQYEISGCLAEGAVNLYLTSFLSDKGFPYEAFQTTAINIFKLQAVNELIILVDTQDNPYIKTRTGGIYLYAVNFDEQIPTPLVQVEYIDGDDLGMEDLGDIYINNAQLTYHAETGSYRLYFTQLTRGNLIQYNSGIFVIDFKYSSVSNSISIRAINYLKIQPLLSRLGYQMPYDASYQAVTQISSVYDQTLKKSTDKILLTSGKFHTIELTIDYGIDGSLQQIKITRLYQRYAFYDIQNYIKYHNGLFVISQILPDQFDIQNRSKQILTTYSTTDNRTFTLDEQSRFPQDDTKVQERGFLGGFRIDDKVLHYYDFNLTFTNDGHTEPRVGMVLIQSLSNKIQKFTLHQNLSVVTKQTVDTQVIFIDLKNDFSLEKIRILINGRSPYPEWKLITIILFSIIGGIILIIALVIGIRILKNKYQNRSQQEEQPRDSLITSNDRKSFEPLSLKDTTQDKYSQKQQKKKMKQMQKQQKKRQKQQKEAQKQRIKQEKQAEKLRMKQDKQRQKYQKNQERQSVRSQKQSEASSQKQRQRQAQRQRLSQRQSQKQRQSERQKQRQSSIGRANDSSSFNDNSSRFQTRNNYEENKMQQDDDLDGFSSRFRDRDRRPFRERAPRNTDFSGGNNNNRQAPSSSSSNVRGRRNIAIIQQ